MTRSFLMRAAMASVPLTIGLVFSWPKNSMYDRMIENLRIAEVGIVLAGLVAFFIWTAIWVLVKLKPSKWAQREAARGKSAAVIAVISAACLAGQPAHGVVMELPVAAQTAVQSVAIDQPFTLSPEAQTQVDCAIAAASKDAQDAPGFVVSAELAIGIFIAAVVVGTVLVIIVRMVCKSLDRMREDLSSRLSRLKNFLSDPRDTNQPAILGAALFSHRAATTNDLSVNAELVVGFTASSEPMTLTAALASGETVTVDEFVSDFGLTSKFPADSVVGQGVDRVEGGYQVAPAGVSNFVTLVIESTTNLVQEVWSKAVKIVVPAGAVLDFADLTGNSEGRFWRVGVAQ